MKPKLTTTSKPRKKNNKRFNRFSCRNITTLKS